LLLLCLAYARAELLQVLQSLFDHAQTLSQHIACLGLCLIHRLQLSLQHGARLLQQCGQTRIVQIHGILQRLFNLRLLTRLDLGSNLGILAFQVC
jgi:hypothetical protein